MPPSVQGIGRDRLSELKSKYDLSLREQDPEEDHKAIPDESKFLTTYYSQVANVKSKMDSVQKEIDELHTEYSKLLGISAGTSEQKKLKETVSERRKAANKQLFDIRDLLTKMKSENTKVKFLSAEYRIRENQHSALMTQYAKLLEGFNRENSTFHDKEEETLKRQIKVVDPTIPDEKVEEMVEDKEFDLSKYMDSVLLGSSSRATVSALYQSAKETRDDLLELEDSMEELVQLFRDLNALVHDQTSMINNIEFNVARSSDAMESGVKNVRQARKMAKKCVIQ